MSRIVDIPLNRVELPEDRRCIHVRMDGYRCAREATMRERCEIHYTWFVSSLAVHGMPFPEDAISLQMMLGKALDLLAFGRVDYKKAKGVVEICKLMAQNVRAYYYEEQDAERAFKQMYLDKKRQEVIAEEGEAKTEELTAKEGEAKTEERTAD